jgi:hypothetical protein
VTVGWVAAGVGLGALAVGAASGVVALHLKAVHCDNGTCDPGSVVGVQRAAQISDVGLIAGGVLVATGAALVLFTPHSPRPAQTKLRIVPVLAAHGGGVVVASGW